MGTVIIGEHSIAKTRNAPDKNDIEKFILLMANDLFSQPDNSNATVDFNP